MYKQALPAVFYRWDLSNAIDTGYHFRVKQMVVVSLILTTSPLPDNRHYATHDPFHSPAPVRQRARCC
jgi:hypothetical protein